MRLRSWLVFAIVLATLAPSPTLGAEPGRTTIWRGVWNGSEMTVAVIARGHDNHEKISQNEPWWRWGNTSTDAYLFNWTEDEMVDLILDFTTTDGRPQATLYAPRTSGLRQAVTLSDGGYTIPDELMPDLIVSPVAGDWLIDGKPNFNLNVLESNPSTGALQWNIRVGSEIPGQPEWIIRSTTPGFESGIGDPQFGASMRMDPAVPFEIAQPLLPTWPYLSAVDREGHWGRIQPIFFSVFAREFEQNWTGFHIAGMYQINSISPPPDTNFESPFAFYRFDPAAELHANLVIRSDIWPGGDPHGPPPQHVQRTAIRMTWTGQDSHLWRYSLSVAGNHPHDGDVQFGDVTVHAVPYETYPSWIVSRPWKAVTFVEATQGETGSEGIYDFSVEDNYSIVEWINGVRPDAPVDTPELDDAAVNLTLDQLERAPIATLRHPYLKFPVIHPLRLRTGFRGEYSLNYDQIPQLYLSPIDNRVHLLHATEGLWNLGDGMVLRVSATDGGPYINAWQREDISTSVTELNNGVLLAAPGVVQESLFHMSHFILYGSQNEWRLIDLDSVPENVQLPVPTSATSWSNFLESSEAGRSSERDPLDLASWLDDVEGSALTVTRASISEVRATRDGFRFVVRLRPGYRTTGVDLPGLEGLWHGRYVVTYDGRFTVERLTQPQLTATLHAGSLTELHPATLAFTISNDGLRDVTSANLEISAVSARGQRVLIDASRIDIHGESSYVSRVDWSPPSSGRWTVTPALSMADGTTLRLQPALLTVAPEPGPNAWSLVGISTSGITGVLALLGLGGLAALGWMVWWTSTARRAT